MLRLLLVALPSLAALPCHAAPRIPGDDRDVLERLPMRARDPLGSELRALRTAALAVQRVPQNEEAHAWRAAIHMVRADYRAAAWRVERIFDVKLL
jgi:hypothetical protein